MRKFYPLLLVFLMFWGCNENTISVNNPYNLNLVNSIEKYNELIKSQPEHELINLKVRIPNIVLDIRYATKNNFTGEIIYESPDAFLCKPVADSLAKVQEELNKIGLGLKIYDAYRPYSASLKFFQVYPDTNFVANPKYGSRHNRGCAVDLTIIRLATGKEIAMPSDFDDFSERANPNYANLPDSVKANRSFLFETMQKRGFTHYPTEWWHFDQKGWNNFKLMDISFQTLKNK